jgi:hypothetical protein
MDVDLAIAMPSGELSTAKDVLASLGLSPAVAREADLTGGPMFAIRRKRTKPCMVVGRRKGVPGGEAWISCCPPFGVCKKKNHLDAVTRRPKLTNDQRVQMEHSTRT